jgi:carboxyl-terminal processing protease
MNVTAKLVTRLLCPGLAIALTAGALAAPPEARVISAETTEANITRLTAGMLARSQFAHQPLDGELAGKFLDAYLEALDGRRTLFLQSDVEEFAPYRATLAQATRAGNTDASQAIWARYLQRVRERTAYVRRALHTATFEFTGHDSYSFDREHAERPRDLAAAQQLWLQQLRAEYLDEKLRDVSPEQIARQLTRRYTQQLRTAEQTERDDVLETYLNALADVYDPHSDYVGHEQMKSLQSAMNLSLFGIGASLQAIDGYCTIREVLPGGPAARGAVLEPGDRIIAVAQGGKEPVDIVELPLARAVELIRGPKASKVSLTVIPKGSPDAALPRVVTLVRDEIKLEDQRAKAQVLDLPIAQGGPLRLGVINLPTFYAGMGEQAAGGPSVTADVARLLRKLKAEGVQGLIVDLRRNGGGSLNEAISLTGLFIPEGPVVQTRGPAGDVEVESDPDPTELYSGPLIVLTSRFSASASEILAGALKDYGRALVVGDSSTFGKGTVQSIMPLAPVMDRSQMAHSYDPGALKVTIRKFYRPSGSSTQLRGVASDIVLPSTTDFSDINESALDNPLPWDAVPAAAYEQVSRVQPHVNRLRARSARRIAADPEFIHQAKDVARVRENLDQKTVSLNEAERRQELAQTKAQRSERERQRAARPNQRPISYEITVQNAASPGLPKPLASTEEKRAPGSAQAAPASANADDSEDDSDSKRDIVLDETVRILTDYVHAERAPRLLGAN